MINIGKKLGNVAFQSKTWTVEFVRNCQDKIIQPLHCPMRSLINSTRIRVKKKYVIKQRIQNSKYGMMHYSIPNSGFMNYAIFRIADCKPLIWPVAINFVCQFAMQLEQIVFQMPLKFLNIRLASFPLAKFLPSQKQILKTNNSLK